MASLEYEKAKKVTTVTSPRFTCEFKVNSDNLRIMVESAENNLDSVLVHNMSGQQVAGLKLNRQNQVTVDVPEKGIYLVTINHQTQVKQSVF
jgi:hypothetical protein